MMDSVVDHFVDIAGGGGGGDDAAMIALLERHGAAAQDHGVHDPLGALYGQYAAASRDLVKLRCSLREELAGIADATRGDLAACDAALGASAAYAKCVKEYKAQRPKGKFKVFDAARLRLRLAIKMSEHLEQVCTQAAAAELGASSHKPAL